MKTAEETLMDVAHYESILRARQRELHSRLHRIEADLETKKADDSEERATETENDEVLQELGQVGRDELKAIDAALDRLAAGRYGICVRCGQPISERRLAAVPHAPLCEDCIEQ